MGLRASNVLNILKHILGGEIEDSPLGLGVTCTPRDAYIFSALTGATYFDSHVFPFTPKGLLKVFNSVNEYKIVGGLFDGKDLANSPICYVDKKPFLFEESKIIVPVEIDSESSLRDRLRAAYHDHQTNPNILILKIEISKKGHGLEPLMEYVASKIYSAQGYITETQLPLSHSLGSPDFLAYSASEMQNLFFNAGLFSGGFNLIELSMLSTFGIQPTFKARRIKLDDAVIVGEAKTSTTIMEGQIKKYCSSGIFTGAVEIHPTKLVPSSVDFGLLNLNNDIPNLYPPRIFSNSSKTKAAVEFKPWFESYIKAYLIGNYTNQSLRTLYLHLFCKTMTTKDDLVRLIRDITLQDHLQILKGYLLNGSLERRVHKTGNH